VARHTVAGTLAAGHVPELDTLIERYGTDAVARLVAELEAPTVRLTDGWR